MNRRDFIKLGMAVTVATSPIIARALDLVEQIVDDGYFPLPPNNHNAHHLFDPSKEYGNQLIISNDFNSSPAAVQDKLINTLQTDMNFHVPPPYREMAEFHFHINNDIVPVYSIAWYHSPTASGGLIQS